MERPGSHLGSKGCSRVLSCCCWIVLIYVQLSVFFHLGSLGWFLVRKVGVSGKHMLSCGMHRAQPSAPAVFLGVLSPGLVVSPQTGGLGDALGSNAWKQRQLCRCQSGLPPALGTKAQPLSLGNQSAVLCQFITSCKWESF